MSPVEPTVVRSTALYRLSVLSPLALLGVAIAVAGLTLRWWGLALIVPGLAPLPFLGRRTFRAHVTLHADGIAYEAPSGSGACRCRVSPRSPDDSPGCRTATAFPASRRETATAVGS